jgi:hypothetical protein
VDNLADYNNNPGNLRPPKGVKYDGQIGVDERGFAIFENKSFGQRALINDINIKIDKGLNTPEKFIDRYAPAGGENPEEARENYKIKLAAALGLKSTNDPFPKGSASRIADAIYRVESGTEPKQEELRRSEQDRPQHFNLDTTGLVKEPNKKISFSDQAGELMRMAMEADPYRVAGDVGAMALGSKVPAKLESFIQGYQNPPSKPPGVMGGALPTAAPTAPPAAPAASPVVRNVPGSSGPANWTRAMGQNIPDVLAESAESMRKTDPRGGQAIIDRDIKNMEKIRGMGAGNFQLSGSGTSQFMLPPEVAASRPPPPQPPAPPQPQGPGVLSRVQSGLRQAFPVGKTSLSGALGGLGMAEGARETQRRYQEDDMLGATLAGLGTVGSAGAMTPFPPARIAGTVAATASPLALYLYDKMKNKQTGSMPLPAVYARYQR